MELLFCTIDTSPWWRRRRRRRRSPPAITPPPPTPPPRPCNSYVPRLTIRGRARKWVNAWQQSFRVHCPDSYSMFWWIRVFRKCQADRIHHFRCNLGPAIYRGAEDCIWSNFLTNAASASSTYTCGSHGFITGIESDFNTVAKDRRIKVRCCHVKGYKYDKSDCKNTGYKNVYEGLLNFRARPGYTVVGVVSQHSSSHKDRRWDFRVCKFKSSQGRKK